jgi:putative membrane protein
MSYGMMDGWGYMGWGGMAFGGLMMLLWFALLIGLIVIIVRWIGGSSKRDTSRDALEILKKRFARGEIDTTEFEERSEQLRISG